MTLELALETDEISEFARARVENAEFLRRNLPKPDGNDRGGSRDLRSMQA